MARSCSTGFASKEGDTNTVDLDVLRRIIQFLKSYDIARYIEEDTLQQLVSNTFLEDIPDNAVFGPSDVHSPHLAVVLHGTVVVRLRTGAGQPTPGASQNLPQPTTEDGYNVLKTIRAGGYLNSIRDLLSSLSNPHNGETSSASPSAHGQMDIIFQAANQTKIAYVPLLLPSMPDYAGAVMAPGVRALVTKLYKVTFPHSRSHFGLHEQVLNSDLAFQRIPPLRTSNAFSNAVPRPDYTSPATTDSGISVSSLDGDYFLNNELRQRSPPLPSPDQFPPTHSTTSPQSTRRSLDDRSRRQNTARYLRLQTPSRSSVGIRTHKAFKPRPLMSAVAPHFEFSGRMNSLDKSSATELVLRAIGVEESLLRSTASNVVREAMASLELRIFDYGDVLVHHGDCYLGLYMIISGSLRAKATIRTSDNKVRDIVTTLQPGQLVGYSSLVLDSKAMFDFTSTSTGTTIAFLPRQAARLIMQSCPNVMLLLGTRMVNALHPIICLTDVVMDWLTVPGGADIYSAGDESDSIYFIVRGRVRTTEEIVGTQEKRVVETSQGRSFGAMEIYTGAVRSSTVTAVRSTVVARLQKSAYHSLVHYYPPLAINLWGKVLNTAPSLVKNYWASQAHAIAEPCPPRAITILPLSVDIPVELFVEALLAALVSTGAYKEDEIATVTSENISDLVGRPTFTHAGNAYLEDCLSNLYNMVQITILVGDHAASSTWNNICIANSDCLILVGMADGSPAVSDIEERILESSTVASKILVLLETEEKPRDCVGLTKPWIEVRMKPRSSALGARIVLFLQEVKLIQIIQKRDWIVPGPMTGLQRLSLNSDEGSRDMQRLARCIAGKTVALVLGGGGARGFCHLGVLQAFEEQGIPVDLVGGTSMGSMIAALYARERDLPSTVEAARTFARGGTWWQFLWDCTLPVLSVTTGNYFSRLVVAAVGKETDASDLRLPFFCNVTDLTRNSSAKTLHAVAKPLWPMLRASMSVPGLVPPISLDGDLLIDGCFSSNLPVFPALSLGANLIFAVDISTIAAPVPTNYTGTQMSGWWLMAQSLRRYFWGGSEKRDLLTYNAANKLLTYSTNLVDIQAIRKLPNCLYMHLPMVHISSVDMSKFEEIRQIGYESTKIMLEKWKQEGRLDGIISPTGEGKWKED